jgi:hypothetical protein
MVAVGDDEVATPFSWGIKYTEIQWQLQHSEIGPDSRMVQAGQDEVAVKYEGKNGAGSAPGH